jgi:hypothetical protein
MVPHIHDKHLHKHGLIYVDPKLPVVSWIQGQKYEPIAQSRAEQAVIKHLLFIVVYSYYSNCCMTQYRCNKLMRMTPLDHILFFPDPSIIGVVI